MALAGDARRQATRATARASGNLEGLSPQPRITSAPPAGVPDQAAADGGRGELEPIGHDYAVLLEDSVGAEGDGTPHQPAPARNRDRRAADRRLVQYLAARGYQGPAQERLEAALASYGYPVMMAWTRTGEIFRKAAEKGRPLPVPGSGPGWSFDDRAELSAETVAHALVFFRTHILQAGRWDPGRGATIKTYFIGACLHQFPNVYMRWERERRRWRGTVLMMLDDPGDPAGLREIPGHDDPAGTALAGMERDQILAELAVKDPVLRRAVLLRLDGYSDAEAARRLELTPRALEGRWYRYARNLRRRDLGGRRA